MKQESYRSETSAGIGKRFHFCRGFWLYLILLFGAICFTQTLRSKASHIFLVFVGLLPFAMALYVVIAGAMSQVYLMSDSATVEKGEAYAFSFRVINSFLLPVPFAMAEMMLPQANGVRVRERTVLLSVPPLSSCPFGSEVRFRFRGTYDIGVRCLYIYDFFHMFRLRVDVDNYSTVYVMPRRLMLPLTQGEVAADQSVRMQQKPVVLDKLEVSDIRDYRLGDPLKSVHWNLSSKSEELVVRDYNTGTTGVTCIFCDLGTHYPDKAPSEGVGESHAETDSARGSMSDSMSVSAVGSDGVSPEARACRLARDDYYEDMNEYCADGVVELTIAAVENELRAGYQVRLLWFDSRSELGACAYHLREAGDFDQLYRQFATAPVGAGYGKVTELAAMTEGLGDARQIYVIGAMNGQVVSMFADQPVSFGGDRGAEILLFDPEERFEQAAARRAYLDTCRVRLAEKGFRLTERKLPSADGGERSGL